MTKQLSDLIKIGSKVILTDFLDKKLKLTFHIRAVVDKKEVIGRYWRYGKWIYLARSMDHLKAMYDDGQLKGGGKSNGSNRGPRQNGKTRAHRRSR